MFLSNIRLNNGGILESITDCCNPHSLKVIRDCYVTHKMWDKAVNTYESTIQFVPD